ncbi:MAG: hypothetical protein BGO14_10775 [Chlamydiales bacterium 38-26]|nr:SUMF1/EgtB/PvdO family nonheme iron enzyme [Chlamydiales bacterium]OJV11436.1 MAG: hypothetical protein BGO14_10775 [Chlamydiales bacterium 38-26]
MRNYCFFMLYILGYVHLCSADQPAAKNGTLIINYQTNAKGERLDRVRFWLKDSNHNMKMYPREQKYVEDKNLCRTVVIEDLCPGLYTLEFLIPNKDAYFEESPEKKILIKPGEVVKIDQIFTKRTVMYHPIERLREWTAWHQFLLDMSSSYIAQYAPYRGPASEMGIIGGSLNVETNLPDAQWALYQGEKITYRGLGSVSNLIVPPGQGYSIRVKKIPGYEIKVYPNGPFSIGRRQSFVARISYEKAFGYIDITANIPQESILEVEIFSESQKQPIHLNLQPTQGTVQWSSSALPVGEYKIVFKGPLELPALSPLSVKVEANEHAQVSPDFKYTHDLTIESNTQDAIYVLENVDTRKKWQGQGTKFTFQGLPRGHYNLNFASSRPEFVIPPEALKLTIGDHAENIKVEYRIAANVEIETNAEEAFITIISKSNANPTLRDEIKGGKKIYPLTPGEYQIIVEQNTTARQKKSYNISLKEFETKTLQANFQNVVARGNRQELSQAVIISNINEARFKIYKNKEKDQQPLKYQGKYVSVSLEPNIIYELVFEPWDNYNPPQNITFELKTGEHRIIRADYIPAQKLVVVPDGKVLVGDVFGEGSEDERPVQTALISQFSIGVYDVTNALYAAWLTKSVREGRLVYLADFDKKGQVIDLSGFLICKTTENDPYSQIAAILDSEQGIVFKAIPGKDNNPVINVTWYGAQAYCKDHNCRLPTEAEWEKAAAMSLEKSGQPLKKYRYGFSQDVIDRSWANYKYNDIPITNFKVLTSEIGFYNGINLLPLDRQDMAQLRTHDAKSPVGAYDMSGNVFQWVADWYAPRKVSQDNLKDPQGPLSGTHKVAKGGCYASLAEELRVSKRLPLPPDHCDSYTGFRVAK